MAGSDRRRRRALALVALGALSLVWGTQYLVIKAGQATVPPLCTVALRFAVVAVASQAIVWVGGLRAPPGSLPARALFGVAQAVSMGTLYWSEGHIPSAMAAILVATEPFFVAALAHRLVAGERLTARTALALGVGFLGLALITLGKGAGEERPRIELLATLVVVAGCLAGALNKVVGKRLALGVPAPVVMRDMGVSVALALGAASLLVERGSPIHFTARAIAAFAYLGLVASTAASTVYFVLLRRFPVTAMSYLQFVTALVAVATGIGLGRERLGAGVALGACAVLAGLALLAKPRAEERVEARAAERER